MPGKKPGWKKKFNDMETTFHVDNKRYNAVIKLYDTPYKSSGAHLITGWTNLRFSTFVRFKWYFRYRAALVQVEHPKQFVELFEWSVIVDEDENEKRRHLRAKITSAKAKVTEISNKIERAKQQWQSLLFPIENEPAYISAMEKLNQKKFDVVRLTAEYEERYGRITMAP